jgi:hypothetical protein
VLGSVCVSNFIHFLIKPLEAEKRRTPESTKNDLAQIFWDWSLRRKSYFWSKITNGITSSKVWSQHRKSLPHYEVIKFDFRQSDHFQLLAKWNSTFWPRVKFLSVILKNCKKYLNRSDWKSLADQMYFQYVLKFRFLSTILTSTYFSFLLFSQMDDLF